MTQDTKNNLAKMFIILWIMALVIIAVAIGIFALYFDANYFFGLRGINQLTPDLVKEFKIIILMISISIFGGVSFAIRDFYKSIKNSNLFDQLYGEYRSGNIKKDYFQDAVSFELYASRFNYTWVFWFMVQPILSAILGLIAFFIARSGLGLVSGSVDKITLQGVYIYGVITFLAGFFSNKFIKWLDRYTDKLFGTTNVVQNKEEIKNSIITSTNDDIVDLKDELSDEIKNNISDNNFEASKLTTVDDEIGMKTIR